MSKTSGGGGLGVENNFGTDDSFFREGGAGRPTPVSTGNRGAQLNTCGLGAEADTVPVDMFTCGVAARFGLLFLLGFAARA